jgi:hypothetical protein
MNATKRSLIRTISLSLSVCLILLTTSCSLLKREVVVLPESRILEEHPTKEYWTCISDGYLQEVLIKLERCKDGKR